MDTAAITPRGGLRIVAFNVRPVAYAMTVAWAARHGHTIALLVTTPGPAARRSMQYRETIAATPLEQEIVVTTRPKRLVPIIAAVAPDLIVCGSFPYRIPPEVVALPRLGAVNFHPAPLPRYRGPNPFRQIYDGAATLGATLHRIAPEFDAGQVLAQLSRPMPDDVTPETVWPVLSELFTATFEQGLARAVAGEPGTAQDEREATYAGAYGEAECWLDWHAPRRLLQCRATALAMEGCAVKAIIAGQEYTVAGVTPLQGQEEAAAPGTVLDHDERGFTLRVGDGAILVAV